MARNVDITAETEGQLREVLVRALRRELFRKLQCNHDRQSGVGRDRDVGRKLKTAASALFSPVLFLTLGFFFSQQWGLTWWGYVIAPVVALLVFLVALGLASVSTGAQVVVVLLLVISWPVTLVWQIVENGWRAALVTHVLPVLLAVSGFVALVFVRVVWPALRPWLGGLRLRSLIASMPAFFVLVLSALLFALFTEELWETAVRIDPYEALPLVVLPLVLLVYVCVRLWRSVPDVFRRTASDFSEPGCLDESIGDALRLLRGIVGSNDLIGREPRRHIPTTFQAITRLGYPRGPAIACHPEVSQLLRSSFEGTTGPPTPADQAFWAAARLKLTFRFQIVVRLLVFVLLLGIGASLITYGVAAFLIDVSVAERWANDAIPTSALLSPVVEWSFPTGAYLRVALLLGAAATVVFLVFVVTDDKRYTALENTLSVEPIRRCLLGAIPYLNLPSNDRFHSSHVLRGSSGSVTSDNCHERNWGKEPTEPSILGNPGGASVWYRWRSAAAGRVAFTTEGSNFETLLAVYRGSSLGNLVMVAEDTGTPTSHVSFRAKAGAEYRITVDGVRHEDDVGDGRFSLSWQANDDCADAERLTGLSGSTRGSTIGANKEPGERDHAGRRGEASVWYRWVAPATGSVMFATMGSSFDTLLAVYRGSDLGNLALVAENDDVSDAERTSRVRFDAIEGEAYSIAVDGYAGAAGDVVLSWSMNDAPETAESLDGSSGSIRGMYVGSSLWYCWTAPTEGPVSFTTAGSKFDTTLEVHAGSTRDLLSFVTRHDDVKRFRDLTSRVSLTATKDFVYMIGVSGHGPKTGEFVLGWIANDAFTTAEPLVLPSGSVRGSTVHATKEKHERDHAGNAGGASVWYEWTAPADGQVMFTTAGSGIETLLAVYTGSRLADLVEVASSEVADTSPASNLSITVKERSQFLIAVDGRDGAKGDIVLNWGFAPANDTFAAAEVLPGQSGNTGGTTAFATKEPDEPVHAGDAGGASVWYRWTASADGPVTFTSRATSFDTMLSVYRGSRLDALEEVASNYNRRLATWTKSARFDAAKAEEYSIVVDGVDGATGDVALSWDRTPGNDDFGKRVINGMSDTVRDTNVGATKEDDEPEHAGDAGGASIWYLWVAPADGRATFDTAGSTFDTLLAIYRGSSPGSLIRVAQNDDVTKSDPTSSVRFDAKEGAQYAIAVDGFGGATGDVVLSWELEPPPANDDFVAAELLRGETGAVLASNEGTTKEPSEPGHAGNSGGASIWYRWTAPSDGRVTFTTAGSSFDTLLAIYIGMKIADLTAIGSNDDDQPDGTSRVTFAASQGVEYLIAVDGYGGATGNVVLGWELEPPPANDAFAEAGILVGPSGRVRTSTEGTTKELGEPDHAGSAGGASVWYRWTAPSDGQVVITTEGSNFDTLLAVYTGSRLDSLIEVVSNDDTVGRQSAVSFAADAGVEYVVAVDGYSGATGELYLNWALPAANDAFANPDLLIGGSGSVRSTTVGATREQGEPSHAGNPGGASVWYRWKAPTDGRVAISTEGSKFDTLLAVYAGSRLDALSEVASNDDVPGVPGARWSSVGFDVRRDAEYAIAVDGFGGQTGELVLRWDLEAEAPAETKGALEQ